MEIFGVMIAIVIIALLARLIAGGMDEGRVDEYIRSQGGELLDKSWTPFGPGWFGDKSDRIYEVRYRDSQGDIHVASVKTSMLSGVYLTRDRIVSRSEVGDRGSVELAAENQRLRERIEDLERKNP